MGQLERALAGDRKDVMGVDYILYSPRSLPALLRRLMLAPRFARRARAPPEPVENPGIDYALTASAG